MAIDDLTGRPDPEKVKLEISELIKVYRNSQKRLQRQLTKASLSNFADFRIGQQIAQIKAIIRALNAEARDVAEKGVPESYRTGTDAAVLALKQQGVKVEAVNLGTRIHTQAVGRIVDQMTEDLIQANASIERSARQILRETQQSLLDERRINQILASGAIEGETLPETTKRLSTELRNRLGDGQFVQAGSRHFTPEDYAEIVVRTRTREAVTEGSLNIGVEYGVDLFQVSVHSNACPVCQEFQGKVFSLTGATDGFPKLTRKPPYHPRCRHVLLGYIPDPNDETELATLKRVSAGGPLADAEAYEQALAE